MQPICICNEFGWVVLCTAPPTYSKKFLNGDECCFDQAHYSPQGEFIDLGALYLECSSFYCTANVMITTLSLMHPVWITFKILNIWSYPRFYSIKFIHRSGIVNVIETIGQMHKFSGNTLVTFSLTVKNGRMEFWVVFMDNGCYCQWETS